MWSYITLADASHASPSHLDRKMRREQDRMILAERTDGKLRTPGPYPSLLCMCHWNAGEMGMLLFFWDSVSP